MQMINIKYHSNIFLKYPMFILYGFIALTIVNVIRAKKFNYTIFQAIVISIITNIVAIFGAKMLFVIENIGSMSIKDSFFGGGVSFFGTVFFLPLGMLIVKKIFSNKDYSSGNYWITPVPLELAIIRIGCFINGCCLGTFSSWGVHYFFDPIGTYRIPIQLIEAILDIGIVVILWFIEKNKLKINIYSIFMVMYSLIRLIMEFFRENSKNFLGLSNGQIFSLICLIIGGLIIMRDINKKGKKYEKIK